MHELEIYESFLKNDRENELKQAELEGIQKGEAIGIQKGIEHMRREFAIAMLKNGIPIAKVKEMTSLSDEVLQKLQSPD